MRIVEIREKTVPISSPIRNAYIDFSKMTLSLVAVVTDVIRDGKPVVGYGFSSNGRYAPQGLLRERFIPRLMAAKPEDYQGEDGFISDLPVTGPPTGGKAYQPSGTSQWIPGALAAAAFVTNDHEPVDRVYDYYTAMRTRTSSPLRYGSDGWHWWQPYLVSLQMRYGSEAVQNPAEVVPPGR